MAAEKRDDDEEDAKLGRSYILSSSLAVVLLVARYVWEEVESLEYNEGPSKSCLPDLSPVNREIQSFDVFTRPDIRNLHDQPSKITNVHTFCYQYCWLRSRTS